MSEGKRRDFYRFLERSAAWREENGRDPAWKDSAVTTAGSGNTLGDREARGVVPPVDLLDDGEPRPVQRLRIAYALGLPAYAV